MTTTSTPPANWFPDPGGSGQYRYWDGVGWTSHLSPEPLPGGRPPVPTATASQVAAMQRRHVVSNRFSNGAIACGLLALLILPIILGPAGLLLSGKARREGEPRASFAGTVALIGMLGGFMIGCLALGAPVYTPTR